MKILVGGNQEFTLFLVSQNGIKIFIKKVFNNGNELGDVDVELVMLNEIKRSTLCKTHN